VIIPLKFVQKIVVIKCCKYKQVFSPLTKHYRIIIYLVKHIYYDTHILLLCFYMQRTRLVYD